MEAREQEPDEVPGGSVGPGLLRWCFKSSLLRNVFIISRNW